MSRLYAPVTHEMLPKVRDRYPALYYEHARIEVDDSSIKVLLPAEGVVRVPVATIGTLMLGPGTSISHEAVKVMAKANCLICWVGEDSLSFHAYGISPTHDMRGATFQARHSLDQKKRTDVARRMYKFRFPEDDVRNKSIPQLMGMEGVRVRAFYEDCSRRHMVDWRGRRYTVGGVIRDELTNRCITACNQALYAICNSAIIHSGYIPQIGFIHSSGATPFSYDIADLYKTKISVESAFKAAAQMRGEYDRRMLMTEFLTGVLTSDLMGTVSADIAHVLGRSDGCTHR